MFIIKCLFLVFYVFLLEDSLAISSSWPSSSSGFGEKATGMGSLSDMFWDQKYLQSKISVRLVKKSWKLKGLAYENYVDEFPGEVQEAYKVLRENRAYDYIGRDLNKAGELFTVKEGSSDHEFDPQLDTIVLIHPLGSHGDEPFFTLTTLTALGMRYLHKKYNIFLFHMPILNFNMFSTIAREVVGMETKYEPMAETLSSFLVEGIQQQHLQPEKLHLIGYSYSGNLVGYMARLLYFSFKKKISSIMCLDPYSAQYNNDLIHVSGDDAEVVHILHTSSFVEGTRERIGSADFVFNDGSLQPECVGVKNIMGRLLRNWKTIPEPFTCSHLKVVPRFWYIILFSSKFKARRCDTFQRFWNCLCEPHSTVYISYPIVERTASGTFFLRTTDTKPYGLGEEGSHCTPEKKQGLERKLLDFDKLNAGQKKNGI